nr:hypothetical protein [Tanacetum cinerariifolium]
TPKNQGNRNRDAPTRNAPVDTSTTNALVVQDRIDKTGLGYDGQLNESDLNDIYVNKSEMLNNVVYSRKSDGDDNKESDSKDENVFKPEEVKKTVKPSLEKIEFVNARNTTIENENKAEKLRNCSLNKSEQVPVNAAKQSSHRAVASVSAARRVNTAASRPNTYDCNKSYLTDYQEIDGGFVSFGGNAKGDSEDEAESKPKIEKKTVKPSFAKIEFVKSKGQVKSPRKTYVR